MNTLLLLLMCVIEIALAYLTISKKSKAGEWKLSRLIANGGELLLFLLLLLFPGIDMGMRFKLFVYLLVFRFLCAAIGYLFARKKPEKEKRVASKVVSAVLAMILFGISLLPSFIFEDYYGLPTTGEYKVAQAHAILVDEDRLESFEKDGSKREVPIYFYYPENASGTEKFPVVFFSHGAFGYYKSNTSTYMELASHGYVVVSMEHPYHTMFTKDSKGRTIIADSGFLQEVEYINTEEATEEKIIELSTKWLTLRTEDANFVMDTVKEAIQGGTLSDCWIASEQEKQLVMPGISLADSEKMGFMGHSLGGAAAVSLGRTRDDLSAVIDLDGTMLGEITGVENGIDLINEEVYSVPLLSFDNEEHYKGRIECAKNNIPYPNNVVLAHATNGYSTYIAQSGHMNYTDLPLFSPFIASKLGTGEVDAQACVLKMNEIVLQFFDCYLKGSGEFQVEEGYHL